MTLDDICKKQHDWAERMGWHNKTVLECLALIASEVGEAINECRGKTPTEAFGEELADIVLRVADLAEAQGINLTEHIAKKMEIRWKLMERAVLVVEQSNTIINKARNKTI